MVCVHLQSTQSGNGHFLANIMMEKLDQAGERGGGCTPNPFHYIHHHAPAERADPFPSFLLYPYMYSVCALPFVHTNHMIYITEEEMYTVKKRLKTFPSPPGMSDFGQA
jgi:hypothetical protein